MEDWRGSLWKIVRWPIPIIQGFYLQTPGTMSKVPSNDNHDKEKGAEPTSTLEGVGEVKALQRILIHSVYLYDELSSITSVLTMIGPIT